MEGFLGISGYRPDWVSDPEHLVRHHASALGAMLHSELAAIWVLWDTTDEERYADAPVIIQFAAGPRVEICCWRFDEVSVTYDSIDVGKPVRWDGEPRTFEWRRDALSPFSSLIGSHLRSVDLVENELVLGDSTWCLGGLEFGFEIASLAIYNGLDDTQMAVDLEPGVGLRKRPWLNRTPDDPS